MSQGDAFRRHCILALYPPPSLSLAPLGTDKDHGLLPPPSWGTHRGESTPSHSLLQFLGRLHSKTQKHTCMEMYTSVTHTNPRICLPNPAMCMGTEVLVSRPPPHPPGVGEWISGQQRGLGDSYKGRPHGTFQA